ncbi:MAG TPA: cupin domain-containing protein [Novosphingobium sp.]|nr:cupin domain-containing protein [Novosphingobium sp.]
MRRVVTGLNAAGKSAVLFDGAPPTHAEVPVAGIEGYLIWMTDDTPADNAGSADRADCPFPAETAPPRGTCFFTFEYPSLAHASPEQFEALMKGGHGSDTHDHPGMHISDTTDYMVVTSGELTAIMEDGEATLRPGDVMINRGCYRAFENRGDGPVRFAVVTIGAAPRN